MAARFTHLILGSLLLPWSVASAGLLDAFDTGKSARREFLPPDEAFVFTHEAPADGRLALHWDVAPGYYLYRDKFRVEALAPGSVVGDLGLPPGEPKDDPEFGVVQILRKAVSLSPTLALPDGADAVDVQVSYQGCAEDGICYPPIKKTLSLVPGASAAADPGGPAAERVAGLAPALSESDTIAADL